jgi:hypothetical protein
VRIPFALIISSEVKAFEKPTVVSIPMRKPPCERLIGIPQSLVEIGHVGRGWPEGIWGMKGHWLVSLSFRLRGKLTSISLELAERRESAISSDGEWVID